MDNGPLGDFPPAFQHVAGGSATSFPQHRNHSDRVWAHWEYSAQEWELFDHIDWRAARRAYWLLNIVGTLVYLLIVAVVALLSLFSAIGETQIFLVTFFPLVILFLMFVLRIRSYREAKKRHQARQSQGQTHTVTFSKDGVWEAGTHFPLHGILTNLRMVNLTFQPTVLHFRREHIRLRQSNEYDTLRVLVPYGHEEEAARLMQRFQVEVIDASKKTYNPPEPV